jgi:[ribosomal protein S18]-alanine N-acetyltransferase
LKTPATIREYRSEDLQKVLNIFRLNTPAYFSPGEEKDLIFYLENEIDNYFLLELNDEIIGCGGINFCEDKTLGKLSWDFLHPEFQGQGHGTFLVEHRISKLKESAVKKIMVRTSQHAYKFYEKAGFTLVDKSKDYWAPGFDLYTMEFNL